ncbi:uncharacterized protein LOC117238994 [Bombus vosnesenskii]|uniref:Uncharacterized protein LOC117238994 n=1 Tax=Bombus vosnesenskii TaxID=207650 RepID=A0A6J3L3C6_9HYME|nr:uncharacterized protein LOC117238994 [Bombus vosnesenskii]
MYRTGGEFINSDIEDPDGPVPAFDLEATEDVQFCLCVRLIRSVYHLDNGYLCQDCFDNLDPDDQDPCDDPPTHFLCGVPARTQISHCRMCDINLTDLQPAISCLPCMIVYNNLTDIERIFLVQGIAIRTANTYAIHL